VIKGIALRRFAALINKFFPNYASLSSEYFIPLKSYLSSDPLLKSRYAAPPSPD
jgi:hypothetical protein